MIIKYRAEKVKLFWFLISWIQVLNYSYVYFSLFLFLKELSNLSFLLHVPPKSAYEKEDMLESKHFSILFWSFSILSTSCIT